MDMVWQFGGPFYIMRSVFSSQYQEVRIMSEQDTNTTNSETEEPVGGPSTDGASAGEGGAETDPDAPTTQDIPLPPAAQKRK